MQRVLLRLVRDRAKRLEGDVVEIDGKALRRSFAAATARSPPHSVRAFPTEARSPPGQVRAEARSNEVAAAPALLDMPALEGRTVTADAMRARRTTAHGRVDTRVASVARGIAWLQGRHGRSGLAAIGEATATRETRTGRATGTRDYAMSAKLAPERLQHAARSHGAIDNARHWALDTTLNEDRRRNRTGRGPENLALMRRKAPGIARNEPGKDAQCVANSSEPGGTTDSCSKRDEPQPTTA